MSIEALLLAAEFLDKKDRELDHGYASTLPCPATVTRTDRRKTSKLRQIQGLRSSHNELEKNRRAHMKQCLDKLKCVVPLVGDVTKHTTLGLLTNAISLIKILREAEQVQKATKDQLIREQQYLRWHFDQLASGQYHTAGQYRVRPSVSESSSTSIESSSSASSELDDIDVIDCYGLSDDDRSSDVSTGDICGIASEHLIIGTL